MLLSTIMNNSLCQKVISKRQNYDVLQCHLYCANQEIKMFSTVEN